VDDTVTRPVEVIRKKAELMRVTLRALDPAYPASPA
jgi:hypothetical protein